jgi:hypothetical protein
MSTVVSAMPGTHTAGTEIPKQEATSKRIIRHDAGHTLEADLDSILRVHKNPDYCPHCQVPCPRIRRSGFEHPISNWLLKITRRRCYRCLECRKKFVSPRRRSGFKPHIYTGRGYRKRSSAAY